MMGKFSSPRNSHSEEELTQILPPLDDPDATQVIPPIPEKPADPQPAEPVQAPDETQVFKPVQDSDETQVFKPVPDPNETQVFKPVPDPNETQVFKPVPDPGETQVFKPVPDSDGTKVYTPRSHSNAGGQVPPQNRPPRPQQPGPQKHPQQPRPQQPQRPTYENNEVVEKNNRIMVISVCAVLLVVLIALIVGISFLLRGPKDDGLILNNVTAAGVNIGGVTPDKAKELLHRATDLTYSTQDMVIELPDSQTIRLSPADTGVKLDVDAVVKEAFDYGRTGTKAENEQAHKNSLSGNHPIALLPYLNLNLEYIRTSLDAYADSFNSTFQESSAEVTGDKPELNAAEEEFSADAPCQTLVLTLGTPGRHVDIESLYNQVLDAYSFNVFTVTLTQTEQETLPQAIDLKQIHQQYALEPKDAIMDMDSFDIIDPVYGYGFDLEAAQRQLDEAAYGDVIEIPFQMIAPEVLTENLEEVLFRDVLASYKTAHTNDSNRNTNLKLACKAIDGMVLNPGDVFDFNQRLGRRTSSAGYKPAGAYVNGELVSSVGGGICQVSSTLYYCAMVADLEIVTRTAHSYPASYVPLGMDATVSWGGPHFRFRNSTQYPIRIEAKVSGGYVQVKLIGTDEKDYYIKMEYEVTDTQESKTVTQEFEYGNKEGYQDGDVIQKGQAGQTVKTYKCKYSRETNRLIARDYEATSSYKTRDQIVASVPKPTEPPTEPPTQPPTEAPTETQPVTQPAVPDL